MQSPISNVERMDWRSRTTTSYPSEQCVGKSYAIQYYLATLVLCSLCAGYDAEVPLPGQIQNRLLMLIGV